MTGSTTGLGRDAAAALVDQGHDVVVHARTAERAAELGALGDRVAGVVVGDLAVDAEVRDVAAQAAGHGRFDAVIHNAGIYVDRHRVATPDGHAQVLAVNVLAPYLLTALLERPQRLVHLSSGMHLDGTADLGDLDWVTRRWDGIQAYCDSKLLLTALSAAIARRWPDVRSNAVDPGWVPTRMGGPGAPDDLTLGHVTQAWLAVSDDPAAAVTGRYWHHQRTRPPAPAVEDPAFQDAVVDALAGLTGVTLD